MRFLSLRMLYYLWTFPFLAQKVSDIGHAHITHSNVFCNRTQQLDLWPLCIWQTKDDFQNERGKDFICINCKQFKFSFLRTLSLIKFILQICRITYSVSPWSSMQQWPASWWRRSRSRCRYPRCPLFPCPGSAATWPCWPSCSCPGAPPASRKHRTCRGKSQRRRWRWSEKIASLKEYLNI